MRALLFLLVMAIPAISLAASYKKGFVTIAPGRSLYVEHRPAAPGKPTLFLLNGLTYSTREWFLFLTALDALDPDLGIVLYDMKGMGKTLLAEAPVNYDIPFSGQAEDLKLLLSALDIKGEKVAAGLSYGGAVALDYLRRFPDDFSKVIAISPFLAKLPSQDEMLNTQVRTHQVMYPWDPRTADELYDYYLRILITTTYPIQEPIILENPFKLEGVYRMVKGAKKWNSFDVVNQFPPGKLHLVSGSLDQFVALSWQAEFWQAVPPAARASWINILGAPHKLTETYSSFSAAWVLEILNNNGELSKGLSFVGDILRGEATSGAVTIPLYNSKAKSCAAEL